MKLFEVKNWQLQVSEEAWGLLPFKEILDRDKTKEKEVAMKEMLFIYFYNDIRSNYLLMDEADRINEIKKDIGLDADWEMDEIIQVASDFYKKNSSSVIEELYKNTLESARDIGDYLKNTKALLAERDNNGRPIYDVAKITSAVQKVPKLMSDLKAAYKEVVKEREENDNKQKGSRKFNTFEDGLI